MATVNTTEMLVTIDGTGHVVRLVAWDYVAFERAHKRPPSELFEDAMWITHHAAVRTGATTLDFESFLMAAEGIEEAPAPLDRGSNGASPSRRRPAGTRRK